MPERASAGNVIGCFELTFDFTELRRTQQQLAQAEKMEAVGQLTGGLAHDFNNLLTVITGNLATLKDKLPAHQGFENHLEPALAAARRGAELIRRLLTFSRQQSLDPCPVEVGALVHGMMQLLSRSLTERIAIRLDLPTEKLHALIDPHQLESALLNLAINARDAMPDGGRLSIAVAGDVAMAALIPEIERIFGAWRGSAPPPTVPPRPDGAGTPRVTLVDRPGLTQSSLTVAMVGVPRLTPDYDALTMMNMILGGYYASRLNANLREKHGYTYAAQSSFDLRRGPGPLCPQNTSTARRTSSNSIAVRARAGSRSTFAVLVSRIGLCFTTSNLAANPYMPTRMIRI